MQENEISILPGSDQMSMSDGTCRKGHSENSLCGKVGWWRCGLVLIRKYFVSAATVARGARMFSPFSSIQDIVLMKGRLSTGSARPYTVVVQTKRQGERGNLPPPSSSLPTLLPPSIPSPRGGGGEGGK